MATQTTPPGRTGAPAVRAEHLSKVFGSGETRVTALDDVTVAFAAGEFSAIMGPSGSGVSNCKRNKRCAELM